MVTKYLIVGTSAFMTAACAVSIVRAAWTTPPFGLLLAPAYGFVLYQIVVRNARPFILAWI